MDEKEQKRTYEERNIKQRIIAIIQRGKDAGIPDRHLRIPEEDFRNLLSESYHKDVKGFASLAFNRAEEKLFKRPFILIDGGDIENRKRAGFALLFRMIACDRRGSYKTCQELIHKFQTIKVEDGVNRNQYADELKTYDILMLSEFSRSMFSSHFESGSFFDEVFSFRSDNMKPTIITSSDIIDPKNPIRHKDCGEYFANFSVKDITTDEILRVRVKK